MSQTAEGGDRRARQARPGLATGERLGPYIVRGQIGAGGMGVVYRAHDPRLDREIALKVISLRGLACETGLRAHRRLLREAQAMAQLCHPNVLPVYDVGEFDGQVWLAMEHVRGSTLRQWSRKRHRSVDAVLDMFGAAGRGIVAAHRAGLVHRDFKPDNVLVGDDGRVRVMDFGLVRAVAEPSEDLSDETPAAVRAGISLEMPLTRTNVVMGTPAYMAPEQLSACIVGPAADQFAFCVALYEALYGRRPFVGETMKELAQSIAEGPPSFPMRKSVPRGVVRAIRRGLARRPEHRHPSMVGMLRALDRERREGPSVATVAIASACVLVGLGAALLPGPPADECHGVVAPPDRAIAAQVARIPGSVRAEALHRIALLLDASGAPAQAEAPLVDAIHLAQESGHERIAAEAMTHLVQLLGDDPARVDEALEWSRHAEAQVERLGSPPGLLAELRSTTAVVLTGLDRLEEARAMHREALRLRIATLGRSHDDVAVSLTNLGNVAHRAGRHDEAVQLYEQALDIRRTIYGDDHPAVALLLHNLGLVQQARAFEIRRAVDGDVRTP